MNNKGSSVTGILGGAGGGSGGITIGAAVSGGTPSTLLWVDSGGLVASGTTANSIGTTILALGASVTLDTTFGGIIFNVSGGFGVGHQGSAFKLGSSILLTWTSSNANGSADTGIFRVAAGISSPSLGSNVANGWMMNGGGEEALAANYTNATATFSNTNLSITVISGRTYNFEVNLFITESTAADGWQIDFNGGTAAMTNFIANAVSFSETGAIVALANAVSAALATVINATTTGTTGGQWIKIQGSFVPSGNGTFIVRAAQNAHSTGTLTIKRGSNLITRDSRAV